MLQASPLRVDEDAIRAGLLAAKWPARLPRLSQGPLTGAREIWLDGGHNASAGEVLKAHFAGQRLHLVIGMIAGKDPAALTRTLSGSIASLSAVPVPGQACHRPPTSRPGARP